ncbi:hypothetical protein [Tractidigestivibacter scatoligenes]|nr:hypothetical protein [Tractidigestivibacter scatoligenes]
MATSDGCEDERPDYVRAHDLSKYNQDMIESADMCGCFYCLAAFKPGEITEWVDDGDGYTAICPRCGVDSVIPSRHGYPITRAFLGEMREYWF